MNLSRLYLNGLIVSFIGFLPLILYLLREKESRSIGLNWLLCFIAAITNWVVIIVMTVYQTYTIFQGKYPYMPFVVGISKFAVSKIVVINFLFGGIFLVVFLFGRFFSRKNLFVLFFWMYSPVFVLSEFLSFQALEFSHEDTIYTKNFSKRKFESIELGINKQEVLELLGEPFQDDQAPEFIKSEDAFCYVRNWSAGYFAVIWFEEGIVKKKNFWYSD
jgi:hypothetical protein